MDPPTGEEHEAIARPEGGVAEGGAADRPRHDRARPVSRLPVGAGRRPGSTVETFVAVKLTIDSWRWAGVPIYIRAGKCLPVTAVEVTVQFQRPPRETFGECVPPAVGHMRMRVSPDVCIAHGRAG